MNAPPMHDPTCVLRGVLASAINKCDGADIGSFSICSIICWNPGLESPSKKACDKEAMVGTLSLPSLRLLPALTPSIVHRLLPSAECKNYRSPTVSHEVVDAINEGEPSEILAGNIRERSESPLEPSEGHCARVPLMCWGN
ncbi:hypothetical protein PIB30_012939 [Stylosanthes scabra]|uniref:Uncharacterized protein n=1 Tax=Stylosanthes scabra TaxID=79078 RepID=A0ABU6Y4E1_9FABA|nr:hypothetical protein [Stylosanthes scabra]